MSLRILISHNHYKLRGGEDSVVTDEMRLLEANGHEVRAYTRSNDEIDGLGRLRVTTDSIWAQRTLRDIEDVVAEFKPNVIHSHNTFPLISPSIYWAAERHRIPIVQTLHNFRLFCLQAMFLRDGRICEDCIGKLPWKGVVKRCYRDSYSQSAVLFSSTAVHRMLGTYQSKVTRYIALNEFCKQVFIRAGLPADKIRVKPNFVDLREPRHGQRENPIFVGRLSPEKGIVILEEAVGGDSGLSIDVVGTGPLEHQLQKTQNMRLHGWLSPRATYDMMLNASYLVMPSIWYENFPRTLVEAFACGLPVIASNLGAMADIIVDGETGLLFQPGSSEDLRRKMQWANANPGAIKHMGERARTMYETKYSPQTNLNQLIAIYQDAMQAAR